MAIEVDDLSKHFRVHHREATLRASLGSLLHRRYEMVRAVEGASFRVGQGEVVGFLGPNGAGKTTTLKCLAGLLHPTGGQVRVLGFTPHRREREFMRSFTLIMGQRNQLLWDLPALESFQVNRAIYRVPERAYRAALDEFVDLLDLAPLLTKPVRKLSLGERMRCELAASLLHSPRVLFLDEPTLGLDVTAQAAIRAFVRAYNRRTEATVLLTSHYMADVTALAERVVVIDRGALRYDGDLRALIERVAPYRLLRLTLERAVEPHVLAALGEVESCEDLLVTLRVPRAEVTTRVADALAHLPVTDVAIEDPPVEDIIREVFAVGVTHDD